MVRPATTARMVAKAMAEMKAKKTSPAERLGEERRAHIRCRRACDDDRGLTIVAAPKPRNVVMM